MIVLVVVFLILNLMACVVNVIYGHYVIAALALVLYTPVPEWVYTLLGAIGIHGRVTADTKIG